MVVPGKEAPEENPPSICKDDQMRMKLALILSLGIFSGALHAADFSGANVDTVEINDSLVFLRNNSVITNPSSLVSKGSDGVLLVDTGIVETQDVLTAKLAELSGSSSPQFVVNTHFHADHTGGNTAFESATLISHPLLRDQIEKHGLLGKPVPPASLSDITSDGVLTLHFNGEPVRMMALDHGHTLGDMAVLFETSNVLVTGDYYFYNTFPIIDIDNGGSLDGYLANIRFLLEQTNDETRIIPGHSTMAPAPAVVATTDEYRRWYDAIAVAIAYVREAKQAGKTIDDMSAAEALRPLDAFTPLFFKKQRWIKMIYEAVEPNLD